MLASTETILRRRCAAPCARRCLAQSKCEKDAGKHLLCLFPKRSRRFFKIKKAPFTFVWGAGRCRAVLKPYSAWKPRVPRCLFGVSCRQRQRPSYEECASANDETKELLWRNGSWCLLRFLYTFKKHKATLTNAKINPMVAFPNRAMLCASSTLCRP